LAAAGPPIVPSVGEMPDFAILGDEDIVVIVVVAVLGRSFDPFDRVPPDENVGCFSPSSIFCSRVFSSLSSSHMAD